MTMTAAELVAPPTARMTTEEWVRRLNALGAEIDEIAATMHPSAWGEALRDKMDKWKALAKVQVDD